MDIGGGSLGAGGAGNPVGSNPAGTGTGLNYIGNFAYASSGAIQTLTTAAPHLNFTTGAEFIVGELQLQGACNIGDVPDGEVVAFVIKVNGEVVAQPKVGTAAEAMPSVEHYKILLPSYSKVEVEVIAAASNTGWKTSASFVGRVYA